MGSIPGPADGRTQLDPVEQQRQFRGLGYRVVAALSITGGGPRSPRGLRGRSLTAPRCRGQDGVGGQRAIAAPDARPPPENEDRRTRGLCA